MYYKIGQTLSRTRVENVIEAIIDMYNDSPHRGIQGKTSNQVWNDTNEHTIQYMRDTIKNDEIFNKLTLGIGDAVRVLESKRTNLTKEARNSQKIHMKYRTVLDILIR